jgi:sugar O-acyltransferase (sialic acid O-acetyltransferase NeuD family)
MNELHLLGISDTPVAILFDLASEIYGTKKFYFYPNIALDVEPHLPYKRYDYQIMPLGSFPDQTKKVFFATPGPKNKEAIYAHFKAKQNLLENRYLRIVHSSAYVSSSSHLDKGVLIEPLCVVSSQASVGFGVFIKRGSSIGHHNSIGAFTDINPNVSISGNVTIGKGCTIGSGAVLRDEITIGDNTTIGMGSVVTKNIPANCIAYGNPCKVVKDSNE